MKWFVNLKIASKLIISFILVAVLAGAVGLIGIINITDLNKSDTALYEDQTVPLTQVSAIATAFQKVRVQTRDIILATSTSDIAAVEQKIQGYIDDINANAELFEKSSLTDEIETAYQDFQATRKVYVPYLKELIALAKENKDDEANAMLSAGGEMAAATNAEEEAIAQLTTLKTADAAKIAQSNSASAQTAIFTMIYIIAGSMIIAIILGIGISRLISKPIKTLVSAAEKIANGNLDVEIKTGAKDEVGNLSNSFKKMNDNLNEVMATINSAAEQVSTGSKQVSMSSISLSQGATEQASTIEELTASIEEISSQTRQNAENANKANELAESVKANAIEGDSQMGEMLKSMQSINESSTNISKIIKVIDDIAFLTNILALNAAVEAARAGQHGKGFAVVAEEVRNLAARSANAAKETTALIEGSLKVVDQGTKNANDTADALKKIVDGIDKTASIVESIAVASNEQAIGIAQVNQGIMQVSVVIQTNSSTSEESAAASEELSSQASLLKDEVGKFKLRKNQNKSADDINPGVLKMIERMNDMKKNTPEYDFDLKTAEKTSSGISLSENEQSKY